MNVTPNKKVRKPARQRDKDRLYAETLIGRIVHFTPEGLAHFAQQSVKFNAAVRYLTAHPKTAKKRLQSKFKLTSRGTNTILRAVDGQRRGCLAIKEHQLDATWSHLMKSVDRFEQLEDRNRRTGNTRDKLHRLKYRHACQAATVKDVNIFYGRSEYRNQPCWDTFAKPADYVAAHAAWKQRYTEVRNAHFGCLGSHEEEFGNRTYQLRAYQAEKITLPGEVRQDGDLRPRDYYHVPLYHSRKLLGYLRLTTEDYQSLVAYQQTKESVTVNFYREVDRKKWLGHITLMWEGPAAYQETRYHLGVDLNATQLDWVLFKIMGEDVVPVRHGRVPFAKCKNGNARERRLRRGLRALLQLALKHQAVLVIENLDLRRKKSQDQGTGMNRVLHGMPYAKVANIAVRESRKLGVPIRLVNAAFTSIAGGIFSAPLTRLSRDHGAAVVIGLLGTYAGCSLLNRRCQDLLTEGGQYRTTRKGEKNLTVSLRPTSVGACKTPELGEGRQRTAQPRTDLSAFYMVGQSLKGVMENLYAPDPKPQRRQRGNPPAVAGDRPVSAEWQVFVRGRNSDFRPLERELAAGSLNVKNPNNFWAFA